METGNDAPTASLSPASITPSLWFYNHKSEKMEYSGFDVSGTAPIDPPLSLLRPPCSCRCPDCLSGRSRFVGRINPQPDQAVNNPSSTSSQESHNPCLDDDINQLVQRAFPTTNNLHGFVDNLPNNFHGFGDHVGFEETLNIWSRPNSAQSSPEADNATYHTEDIEAVYNGCVDTKRVKAEPLDDLPLNDDLFLQSNFEAWFEQDFKP